MGGSYVQKGVNIGVPRYSFDPKSGDSFYIHGKAIKVKSRSGDMVKISPSVQGINEMSVGNLYQVARVPESSRFAPYGSRVSNPVWKTITAHNVGKYFEGFGYVMARDVGKKYYVRDGSYFVENDAQMQKRLGKSNPRKCATTGSLIPAKLRRMPNGSYKVYVPASVARRMNPESPYKVRKLGDNYGLYFKGQLVQDGVFATRQTAEKHKSIAENDWYRRQAQK